MGKICTFCMKSTKTGQICEFRKKILSLDHLDSAKRWKKPVLSTVYSCCSPARRGHWRVPKPENWIVWAGGLSTGRVAAGIMRPAAQTATPMTMTANKKKYSYAKMNNFLCYLVNPQWAITLIKIRKMS